MERQPPKLTQKLDFSMQNLYVLDISYILKSKTIITDLVKKELPGNY